MNERVLHGYMDQGKCLDEFQMNERVLHGYMDQFK